MKVGRKTIPDEVKKQVDEIVERFNREVLKDPDFYLRHSL
jgi:hypothetical protein